jgi:hypothetical protein
LEAIEVFLRIFSVLLLVAVPWLASGEAVDAATDAALADVDDTPAYDLSDMDDILVEGEKTEIDPVMMGRIRYDHGRGARLYRAGKYEEALPYLLVAAKRGFKLSQARVSYIYHQGFGDIPRDAEAAIGWLGAAASPTSNPEIRNYFKRFRAGLPVEYHAVFDSIVEDYVARYGSKAVGMDCTNTRQAGTHISNLKCDFKDEYEFRDGLDDGSISEGISFQLPSFNAGGGP